MKMIVGGILACFCNDRDSFVVLASHQYKDDVINACT